MKPSPRFVRAVGLGILGAIATVAVLSTRTPDHPLDPGTLNAARILEATRAYAKDRVARGLPIPTSVPLAELIDHGWIHRTDAGLFASLDVVLDPNPDESQPGGTLVRIRLPDATLLAALVDGSVQTLPPPGH